jgi:hypothetical protein
MARVKRVRETLKGPLSPEYLKEKADAGWKLVAVEWQREVEVEQELDEIREDVPFGLRVADDCMHLEENPVERQALVTMMDLIVQDHPLSKVAEELNHLGQRTRQGARWSPVSVFNMLPRLIEVGPLIFSSEEWAARKDRLLKAV